MFVFVEVGVLEQAHRIIPPLLLGDTIWLLTGIAVRS